MYSNSWFSTCFRAGKSQFVLAQTQYVLGRMWANGQLLMYSICE